MPGSRKFPVSFLTKTCLHNRRRKKTGTPIKEYTLFFKCLKLIYLWLRRDSCRVKAFEVTVSQVACEGSRQAKVHRKKTAE